MRGEEGGGVGLRQFFPLPTASASLELSHCVGKMKKEDFLFQHKKNKKDKIVAEEKWKLLRRKREKNEF